MSKKRLGIWLVVGGVVLINLVWFITPIEFQSNEAISNISNPYGLGNWLGLGAIVAGLVLIIRKSK